MNLSRLIEDNIARFGEYDYLYFEGQWHTNVEINRTANRLGNALKEFGIRKGDRVGVQLFNCPQLIETFLAIFKIGAIVVPVNPALRPSDAAYIYRDSGVRVLVTSVDHLGRVEEACQEAAELEKIIVIDSDDAPGAISYNKLVEQSADKLTIEDTDNDDIAALIYTAGTTGRPKGVMLNHYSFYTHVSGYYEMMLDTRGIMVKGVVSEWDAKQDKMVEKEVEVFGINYKRVSLMALPLFHAYGIVRAKLELLTGGRLILLRRWDAEEAMKLIEQHKVTDFPGVPTMYIQILNHPNIDKHDLSSLQTCVCGSAPMPLEVAREWQRKYGVDIWEGYGLTEATAVDSGNIGARRPPKYGSVGKCYQKCNTFKIFDQNDQELPPGKEGEIVIRGPAVMKGYWNMPEETAEALRGGWLHTGDIGYMDEDGYIYLTERKKDLIIRGGENIYPKEVENVLYDHGQVLEAGVIGIPHPVYGEEVKAFVALKSGASVTEEELIDFCKQHLPTYKRPKSIQFLGSLPKSAIGKILRKELRALG